MPFFTIIVKMCIYKVRRRCNCYLESQAHYTVFCPVFTSSSFINCLVDIGRIIFKVCLGGRLKNHCGIHICLNLVLKPTITKFRDSIYKVIHAGKKKKKETERKHHPCRTIDKKCNLKSPHVCYFVFDKTFSG